MDKPTFNELEVFLLAEWPEARQLEQGMGNVRKKYEDVLKRVQERVKRSCPELDDSRIGKWSRAYDGWQLGFGRKQWPISNEGIPCGYWLYDLDLEALASEREPPPGASIWLKPAGKKGVNLEQVRHRIEQEARKSLPKEILVLCSFDDENHPLSYTWPESRKDLLGMLVQNDSQAFIDCLTTHIEVLSQFTPILDSVLLKGKR